MFLEWYPDKTLTAKMIMQFNMAAAFAIRGELDKAGELLKYIWSIKTKADIPLSIVMLALYIELQLGKFFFVCCFFFTFLLFFSVFLRTHGKCKIYFKTAFTVAIM